MCAILKFPAPANLAGNIFLMGLENRNFCPEFANFEVAPGKRAANCGNLTVSDRFANGLRRIFRERKRPSREKSRESRPSQWTGHYRDAAYVKTERAELRFSNPRILVLPLGGVPSAAEKKHRDGGYSFKLHHYPLSICAIPRWWSSSSATAPPPMFDRNFT